MEIETKDKVFLIGFIITMAIIIVIIVNIKVSGIY